MATTKMLNGIEVPTPCRMVLARSSANGPEYPAIVIDGVDLTLCLYRFTKEERTSGLHICVYHESMAPDPRVWRWRWPPREEQATTAIAPAAEPSEAFKALTAERDDLQARLVVKAEALNRETHYRLQLAEENEKLREEIKKTKLEVAAADAAGKTTCAALLAENTRLRGVLAMMFNTTIHELQSRIEEELQKLREMCYAELKGDTK